MVCVGGYVVCMVCVSVCAMWWHCGVCVVCVVHGVRGVYVVCVLTSGMVYVGIREGASQCDYSYVQMMVVQALHSLSHLHPSVEGTKGSHTP